MESLHTRALGNSRPAWEGMERSFSQASGLGFRVWDLGVRV